MAKLTNQQILTRGQKYYNKKKKSNEHRVEEVTFDADARLEYLTGFHKRKVHRQEVAKASKEKQMQQERLEERQRIREERKRVVSEKLELLKKQKEIEQDMAEDSTSDEDTSDKNKEDNKDKADTDTDAAGEEVDEEEEWYGFSDNDEHENGTRGILKKKVVFSNLKQTAEDDTINEETLVTIESLGDAGSNKVDLYKLAKLNNVELEKSKEVLDQAVDRAKKYAELTGVAKPKKKKFRYLTKSERRANNFKSKVNKRKKI